MVLTLGILGLVLCAFCAPVALFMGKGDLRAMDAGRMDPAGRGTTQAGWILGIIGTVILCLQVLLGLLYIVFVVFILGLAATSAATNSRTTGPSSSPSSLGP